MAVTINEGTQTDILTTQVGGTETQIVRLDVGTGTAASDWGGSVTVSNVNVGTLARVGTVQNIDGGTIIVNTIQFRHADEFATVISTGTSTLGTIRGSVAGSQIFITDLIVSAGSATDVEIASGGTSTPIIGTLHFGEDGGMVAPNFKVYPRTSAGSALVYKQSANIPLTITCHGYID